jgi:hypothetical protein
MWGKTGYQVRYKSGMWEGRAETSVILYILQFALQDGKKNRELLFTDFHMQLPYSATLT